MEPVIVHLAQNAIEEQRMRTAVQRVVADSARLEQYTHDAVDHVLEVWQRSGPRARCHAEVRVVLEGVLPQHAIDQALGLGFKNYDALRSDEDLYELRRLPEWRKTLEKHGVFL